MSALGCGVASQWLMLLFSGTSWSYFDFGLVAVSESSCFALLLI